MNQILVSVLLFLLVPNLALSQELNSESTNSNANSNSSVNSNSNPNPNPNPNLNLNSVNEVGPNHLLCRNKNVVRTILIEKKNSHCIVSYTKSGEAQIVGKSTKDSVCREVLEKIKVNLEKGGEWKCKDVSKSGVSISDVEP